MSESGDRLPDSARVAIDTAVQTGVLDVDSVVAYLDGEGLDPEALRTEAAHAFDRWRTSWDTWPPVTDVDRVEAAFIALARVGIVGSAAEAWTLQEARQRAWHTVLDREKAGEAPRGLAVFTIQDALSAVEDGVLFLGFGTTQADLSPADEDQATAAIGREVAAALAAAGLTVTWDGSPHERVRVHLHWQRRPHREGYTPWIPEALQTEAWRPQPPEPTKAPSPRDASWQQALAAFEQLVERAGPAHEPMLALVRQWSTTPALGTTYADTSHQFLVLSQADVASRATAREVRIAFDADGGCLRVIASDPGDARRIPDAVPLPAAHLAARVARWLAQGHWSEVPSPPSPATPAANETSPVPAAPDRGSPTLALAWMAGALVVVVVFAAWWAGAL